ncbi:MAG: DUF4252 domain-containing protein [Ignavibacteriaceae bacterium]
MKRKIVLILPVILFSFFVAGCYDVDGNFLQIKNEILSSTGNHFNKDVEFSLGSVSMSLAFAVIKLNGDDADGKDIIKNISSLQIGVYKNRNHSLPGRSYDLFERINDTMDRQGWENFVRETNNGELTLGYVKYNQGDKLNKMFVVSLNKEELTLVEMRGDMGKVIVSAIKGKGFWHGFADAQN